MRYAGLAALLFVLPASTSIPLGTELTVRLSTAVSSTGRSGQKVEAVVIVPLFLNGVLVIDMGAKVTGTVADVHPYQPANGSSPEQVASLRLQFTQIEDAGKSIPLPCALVVVDNARESVDSSGLITGIQKSQAIGSQIDRGITKLSEKYGQFGGLLSQVKSSIVKDVDPSIDFKPGVELRLRTTRAFDYTPHANGPAVGAITPADQLAALVNAEPFRTAALKPPEPSDMTNVMFIATPDQLKAAFDAAGWFPAQALSQSSKMETARAIIEERGYNEAPMSVLTLDGQPPDLALQKQNDTFAMRHHIRIWQRPDTFNGKPVWVAAATHDTSITFSQTSRSFTHGIDPNIDGERSKVVNDMLFTGKIKGVALVDRTNLPPNPSNATGDHLLTDGKMAVLQF